MFSVVCIIGAGPAGAILAEGLARGGMRVLLFDHKAPWEKPCGGMLSPKIKAACLFPEGYPYAMQYYDGIKIISSRGDTFFLRSQEPFPVVSRRQLGEHLLSRAVSAGAEYIREKVIDICIKANGWKLATDKKGYECNLLVGADGTKSIVRKILAEEILIEHLTLACGYFLENISHKDCLVEYLDIQGYLWIVSCSSHTSAGILARYSSTSGRQLFARLDEYLHDHYPEARIVKRWSAFIPSASDESFFNAPCAGKNWLLVGDAAGHVDPIVGEGIYYALRSAECAREAILSDDIPRYEDLWRSAYGRKLRERAEYMKSLITLAESFSPEMMGAMMYRSLCRTADS